MRAALTVRRKQKEDLKEALAGHLFPVVFAFAVGETKFLPLQILLFTRGKLPYAFPFCALLLESVLGRKERLVAVGSSS